MGKVVTEGLMALGVRHVKDHPNTRIIGRTTGSGTKVTRRIAIGLNIDWPGHTEGARWVNE